MGSLASRKLAGLSMVMLIALLAVRLDGLKHVADDCSAGKPYCYDVPVHLDSPINTPGFEGKPALSSDGLELYFVSDRPGALGGPGDQDIYVTKRSSVNGAWDAPERVPPPVSSAFFDITPTISLDGLSLYFGSNRPGPFSPPWPDLWVTHRASVNHPWGPAVNLGAGINTPLFEGSIDISPDQRTVFFAAVTPDFVFDIYMARRSSTDERFGAINHLYVSERQNDRAPWGPRIYLDTLNCPTCFGGLPTIRAGGKEICWTGDRGDSLGDKDIYCATRR